MARIVELLVGLNALGGIATFLGLRYAARKGRDRIVGIVKRDEGEQP